MLSLLGSGLASGISPANDIQLQIKAMKQGTCFKKATVYHQLRELGFARYLLGEKDAEAIPTPKQYVPLDNWLPQYSRQ